MKLLAATPTKYQRILDYMCDRLAESELTAHEREMIDRWNEAWTLMRNYNSKKNVVAIMRKRWPDMSVPTLYRDVAASISLFGDISKSTKEGIRNLASEIILDSIEMARAKNKPETMILGAEKLAIVNAVNNEDPDMPDWENYEPNTYVQNLDAVSVKALQQLLKTGKINFSSLLNFKAEDAVILPDDEQRS